ncbi:bifunctional diaminohydroxyphosphoribosylaminopyrimidine deaminase/5-amino-6-(5-phosphoribosylamino)uracil reductase RibD [Candidatus Daviesbacteria bacterium]|nr:bifunctional diaminohydroxyphosphoribosylaminopyrimidine deaminase/5-amino-6-(5-phosphoribosylamino)uracil reductase RibD [Candidatus Daviesbacteria bacterium]
MDDKYFLKETLKLAKMGSGWTNPNPMVGAVIVKNGRLIGKGFHRRAGSPHAEIEALNKTTEDPKGSTLYINLEPCSFFGKTPPCTDAIIKSKIKKVVFSSLDPNPKVCGKGKEILEKAGIQTTVGTLENEARTLNEAFFTYHEKKRPFIALKFAASLDGKIATKSGHSKWITNERARKYARSLRGKYHAVLVGINTVVKDNPHLGVRVKGKKDPIRIILGDKKQIHTTSQVLRDNNFLIISTKTIPDLLSVLKEKEIISVLVEGGGETLGNFLDCGIIDKVYAFHAPILIGGKNAVSIGGNGAQTVQKAMKLKNISYKKFSDNLLTTGYAL